VEALASGAPVVALGRGGATEIVRDGVTTKIVGLEPMSTAEGIAAFTPFQRRVLRMLKRTHFVKLIAA